MEICCDNLPWKVYNQFGGGVDTSTLGKATANLTLFAIVSVLLVSFLLFFITNLDWGSVIGKRFP
jgi:Cu/Ag efflux pump CusA